MTTYASVLCSTHTVKAVHVFTDLERLSEDQLVAAAGLYRALRQAGIPCLNDPARVMGRYQLLCKLFDEGINPFGDYRADEQPKPAQFPVFVRNESNHNGPMSALIKNQQELEGFLKGLIEGGRPLRGLLVVEYAAEAGPDGIFRKSSTHRIGKNYAVECQILSDNWVVKNFAQHLTSNVSQLEEQAQAIANYVPESVRRAVAEIYRKPANPQVDRAYVAKDPREPAPPHDQADCDMIGSAIRQFLLNISRMRCEFAQLKLIFGRAQ